MENVVYSRRTDGLEVEHGLLHSVERDSVTGFSCYIITTLCYIECCAVFFRRGTFFCENASKISTEVSGSIVRISSTMWHMRFVRRSSFQVATCSVWVASRCADRSDTDASSAAGAERVCSGDAEVLTMPERYV